MTCTCGSTNVVGVQYRYDHPEHYDGVSEWHCQDCGRRVGRWSGKDLKEGEAEPRYGNHLGDVNNMVTQRIDNVSSKGSLDDSNA